MTKLEKLARRSGLKVQTVAFDTADIYKKSSVGRLPRLSPNWALLLVFFLLVLTGCGP